MIDHTTGTRSAVCGWCGRSEIVVDETGSINFQALAEMQRHEITCPKNPIAAQLFKALARIEKLEAVAAAAREHRAAEDDEADQWGYRLAAAREQVDAALAALEAPRADH